MNTPSNVPHLGGITMPELNGRKVFETREFPRCPVCNSPVQLEQAEKDALEAKYKNERRFPPTDLPYHPAFFPDINESPHPTEPDKAIMKLYSTCRMCGNFWVSKLHILSNTAELTPSPGKPSPSVVKEGK